MKRGNPEGSSRLAGGDWRGEIHFALEPVECQVARCFAFRKHAPSRYTRAELIQALVHQADGLLHADIIARKRCAVERIEPSIQASLAFVNLLGRERVNLSALLRR